MRSLFFVRSSEHFTISPLELFRAGLTGDDVVYAELEVNGARTKMIVFIRSYIHSNPLVYIVPEYMRSESVNIIRVIRYRRLGSNPIVVWGQELKTFKYRLLYPMVEATVDRLVPVVPVQSRGPTTNLLVSTSRDALLLEAPVFPGRYVELDDRYYTVIPLDLLPLSRYPTRVLPRPRHVTVTYTEVSLDT